MIRSFAPVLALAAALGARTCLAQVPHIGVQDHGPLPPARGDDIGPAMKAALEATPLLRDLTFDESAKLAKKQTRLHVIFWSDDSPDNPNWSFHRSLKNASLRAYIHWHAVAIHSKRLPPKLLPQVLQILRQQNEIKPAVIVLRDGEIESVIGTTQPFALGGESNRPSYQFIPKPPRILFQVDFAMERIAARDPVWHELHNRENPPPAPPGEPEPFCTTDDKLAPIVRDPAPEESITALDRLAEARRLLKAGDYYAATGVYTWLWERAAEIDPAFRPARLSALVPDIQFLVGKRDGARERFEKIKKVRTDRLLWATYTHKHDWFVLNAATNAPQDTLEHLDYFVNNEDESTLLPPVDSAAFSLLAARTDYAAAWELPANPRSRMTFLVRRLNPKFPSSTLDHARAEYLDFARQFLLDEGCRLYVAALVKGDDQLAADISASILTNHNTALARLSLITTALSAEPPQVRPTHLTWLTEAESAVTHKRDDLRTRLKLLLAPPPPSETLAR